MKKEWEARFMLFGFVMLLCAVFGLTYIGNPPVQKFVDNAWQSIARKTQSAWTDLQKMGVPSAEKLIDRGQKAQSNELKGLQLLERTKACEGKKDKEACEEIGESIPVKASKCPPEVSACASYEKYEAKRRKKSS